MHSLPQPPAEPDAAYEMRGARSLLRRLSGSAHHFRRKRTGLGDGLRFVTRKVRNLVRRSRSFAWLVFNQTRKRLVALPAVKHLKRSFSRPSKMAMTVKRPPQRARLAPQPPARPTLQAKLERARNLAWRAVNQTRKRIAALPVVGRLKRALFDRYMAMAASRLPDRDNPAPPERVRQMLIFGDMGLGNFLMFTPALTTLRRRFPDAEIVAIFFKARGAEVIASGNPDIDRIVTVDLPKRAGLAPFLSLVRTCRRERIAPDMVVARWNGNPYVALLTAWLRPRTRLGHVSSAGYKGYADEVFNFPVAMSEDAHEVERNLDLARAMGAEPATHAMHMPISQDDRRKADALIAARGFDPARLICLQTGSSKLQKWKRWPERHWTALTTRLAELGYDLAFVGSAEEADVARRIIEASPIGGLLREHNICGELTVNQTAAFLARSAGIICNDSGLMHVAAAVGTPIVGLFGPTEYDRTRPFVENCVVLRKTCHCNHGTLFDRGTLATIEACNRPCLSDTGPEEVLAEVRRLMPVAAGEARTPARA